MGEMIRHFGKECEFSFNMLARAAHFVMSEKISVPNSFKSSFIIG